MIYPDDNIHDAMEKIAGAKRLLRTFRGSPKSQGHHDAWLRAQDKYERRTGITSRLQNALNKTKAGEKGVSVTLKTDPGALLGLPKSLRRQARYDKRVGSSIWKNMDPMARAEKAIKAGPRKALKK